MNTYEMNSAVFLTMLGGGVKNLTANAEYVNSINVFPIPDGDTGTNMKATLAGAYSGGQSAANQTFGGFMSAVSKGALMSARGNSGVILSQFIKGIANSLSGKNSVSVRDFAAALEGGWRKAYEVVKNPTEGTMLTVMREAERNSACLAESASTVEEYLEKYIDEAKKSLMRTPELLPVLKKAGVIDSGGAGLCYIFEGMLKALNGEDISGAHEEVAATSSVNTSAFNADSELTFGYCTEFILQLQNSKVDTAAFDLKTVTDYLDSVGGESVVAFKDEDIIKVHVHTFDPGKILSEMRKYGEFLTVKIENMNLQHSEHSEYFEKPADKPVSEHKKIATVAVATGEGAVKAFEDAGVDAVVSGGQTMNTSINDFLETFEKIDADYIFVYPNNPNIIMAASLASENYDKAKIVVIPTKTVSEGYSAVSMLDTELEPSELEAQQKEVIGGVKTVEVTYAVRDTLLDGVEVKKDDYICISAKRLLSADKDRIAAVKAALEKIEDFSDKQLMTVFTGKGIDDEEYEELCRAAEELNPLIEIFKIDGGQEVYSYIIGIE